MNVDAAFARVRSPLLAIGVQSDILYPLYQSQEIVAVARRHGVPARSVELDSPHGHDAFLIEHDQVGIPLSAFLDDVEHRPGRAEPAEQVEHRLEERELVGRARGGRVLAREAGQEAGEGRRPLGDQRGVCSGCSVTVRSATSPVGVTIRTRAPTAGSSVAM